MRFDGKRVYFDTLDEFGWFLVLEARIKEAEKSGDIMGIVRAIEERDRFLGVHEEGAY